MSTRATVVQLISGIVLLLCPGLTGCVPPGGAGFAEPELAQLQVEPTAAGPLSVSFDLASVDRYVWRGLILTDGPVIQPSVTVGDEDWSVNIWGNMDVDAANDNKSQFNELDVTLGWGKELGKYALSASIVNYNFPNTPATTTTELCLGIAADVPAQPAVEVYFDLDEAQGTYIVLNIGHSFGSEYHNPMKWELTLDTGIGWGSAEHNILYFGSATEGMTDFHLGLAFAVKIHDKWTVSQNIINTSVMDEQLRATVAKDRVIAYGIVLTVEF